MLKNAQSRWLVRLVTMVLWAMAAASVVWWGLRIWGGSALVPTVAQPSVTAPVTAADPAGVARLLGAAAAAGPAAAPATPNRFVLLGVVASPSKMGSALIAVDGKPGRAFRVGSTVDEGIVLEAVEPRKARLGQLSGAGQPWILEMPLPKKQGNGGMALGEGRATQPTKAIGNQVVPE